MASFLWHDWLQLALMAVVYAFIAKHISHSTGGFLFYFLTLFGVSSAAKILFDGCDLAEKYGSLWLR